jgi:hypothetical protein
MSDVMLHAVLCMPPELWDNSALDRLQRHSRYLEASNRIETQADRIKELEAEVARLSREVEERRAHMRRGMREGVMRNTKATGGDHD